MACFIVSAAEAAAAKALEKSVEKKEEEDNNQDGEVKIALSTKLKWLSNLLMGGSVLLAFEHIWHGEIVPWFPFLTAMSNLEDASEMFHEMATVGVCMALLITLVWFCMCKVADSIMQRSAINEIKESEA